MLAPKAFMTALAEGMLTECLMACNRTKSLAKGGRKRAAIKMGYANYSQKSLDVYHSALLHFLAWSEMRSVEAGDTDRYSFQTILHYRSPAGHRCGSLEDYESDMKDKRRPELRSKNPDVIQTRISVANAFLAFCVSQGFRHKPFSPYLSQVSRAYLDRDEALHYARKIPQILEIEELGEFVRNQRSLRDRAATGLMVFGGLRVNDLLQMRLADVPRRLDLERRGTYRVALNVFGKGRKWRETTIPEWVYNDVREYASRERHHLRKSVLHRGENLPMGKNAAVFVSTARTPNFGQPLTPKFVRAIFEKSKLGHPHLARHGFACWRMIELLAMRGEGLSNMSASPLAEVAMHFDVANTLALEMGHNRIATTEIYLKWARRRLADREMLADLLARIKKVHHER